MQQSNKNPGALAGAAGARECCLEVRQISAETAHAASQPVIPVAKSSRDRERLFWMLQQRKEAEALTDEHGAQIKRRLIYPPTFVEARAALHDEIGVLRGLLAGGDISYIQGPLELFIVLTGPVALTIAEAVRGL